MTANAYYTVYRLHLDGSVSDRADLNDRFEVEEWASENFGKFAYIRIVNCVTGKVTDLTDDGTKFVPITFTPVLRAA